MRVVVCILYLHTAQRPKHANHFTTRNISASTCKHRHTHTIIIMKLIFDLKVISVIVCRFFFHSRCTILSRARARARTPVRVNVWCASAAVTNRIHYYYYNYFINDFAEYTYIFGSLSHTYQVTSRGSFLFFSFCCLVLIFASGHGGHSGR